MAPLNIDAPEFFPNQLNILRSPSFATPFSPPHHHYRFTLFSFRQPNPFFYYYPTVTTTSETKPTEVNTMEETKTSLSETKEQQQKLQLQKEEKKELVIREETNSSKGKGVVQKQVFEIFSCGKTVSRGPRFQAYEWRKREPKEVFRKKKCYDHNSFAKNPQQQQQQNFRASSKAFQKRVFPVVPVRQDGEETTVMIKNIPSKYTREMLVEFLENHCMYVNARDRESGEEDTLAFDFVYLPIDFRTGMNKGYAFVNFTKPNAAWKFLITASDDGKWELFKSHKIRQVVLARIQGKVKLESHFETMDFPYEYEDVLPVSFSPPRDGVIKGDQKTLGRLLKGTHHF